MTSPDAISEYKAIESADAILRGSLEMPDDGVMTGCLVIGIYAMPNDEAMSARKAFGTGMNFYAQVGVLEEALALHRSNMVARYVDDDDSEQPPGAP